MSILRVTRGIPKYNIQIGPFIEAKNHNPDATISVSDFFDPNLTFLPNFQWIPINEGGKSWGYKPFFTAFKFLDLYCLERKYPLVYLCCSAGKHRSPLIAYCWLLYNGLSLHDADKEFYGYFKESPMSMYNSDVKNGYLPPHLPEFFSNMRNFPGANYHDVIQNMDQTEYITYKSYDAIYKF